MVNVIIDGQSISANEGTTILEAAVNSGIHIHTLCYLKDLCDIGACRVCVVEIEGDTNLSAACNTVIEDGMVIKTNSRRVREARKVNVELLLSEHEVICPSCVRGGNCSLQSVAENLGILEIPYETKFSTKPWDSNHFLIRDESKCIKCMRCLYVCDNMQSLGVWDLSGIGTRLTIKVAEGKSIDDSVCVLCGQCVMHCPVGALYARDDTAKVLDALDNPEKVVIMQIAPAVRTAWGEGFNLSREKASVGRMVAAARKLGVNFVFDTSFGADMTIIEESAELLQRLSNRENKKWPMFTSCCPGWVSFIKSQYPELIANLSTTKSPQQIFGSTAKTWFAKHAGIDAAKLFSVAVMPCMAKKMECSLPGMDSAKTGQDVDVVITNREFIKLLQTYSVCVDLLDEEEFDDLLGDGTGAGVIFGSTGGVMEAVLRTGYYLATGKNPEPDTFSVIRGKDATREVTVDMNGTKLKAVVVSGLANTRKLIDKILSGEVMYDFVEVMACPGGCVGGGGQPIKDGKDLTLERAPVLYDLDKNSEKRFSHENPSAVKSYEEFYKKPLSKEAQELLHITHDR